MRTPGAEASLRARNASLLDCEHHSGPGAWRMSGAGAPLRARRVTTSGAEAPLSARSARTFGLGAPLGARGMEDVWSVSPTQGQECEDVWSGSPIQQAPWEESMHAPPPLLRAKNVRTSRTKAPKACTRLCARPAWPRRGPALASWAARPGWESGVGTDVWSGGPSQSQECADLHSWLTCRLPRQGDLQE